MDLTDIYRTFYETTAEYTLFTIAHGTFSRIDHMLGHNTSLSKSLKTEIIPSVFSDHTAMKPGISNRSKTSKFINTWKLNSTLLNNQQIKDKIKGEIKKHLKTNENGNNILRLTGCGKSSSRRDVHSNQCLH